LAAEAVQHDRAPVPLRGRQRLIAPPIYGAGTDRTRRPETARPPTHRQRHRP
jgi:hypothetical protein